jgi:hypothetical protein
MITTFGLTVFEAVEDAMKSSELETADVSSVAILSFATFSGAGRATTPRTARTTLTAALRKRILLRNNKILDS